jgi:hypothetical protein
MTDLDKSSPCLPATASSISATLVEPITQAHCDIDIADSRGPDATRSSMKSYISTSDIALPSTRYESTTRQKQDAEVATNAALAHPPRKSSLAHPHGIPSPLERSQSTDPAISDSFDLAQETLEASRPHSPSPASFSRPRPTSFSQITGMMATPPAASPSQTTPVSTVKSQKTASRIPLPDQKKATLVDIKGGRFSGIPVPKFERGLSFGGRRIDSPDPLKVLDHGIKRRQLQRANTGGSSSTASTVPTRLLGNGTPPVDRSKANTPDSTLGSSSDEEEEITTPSDKPTHFVKHGYKPKHVNSNSGSHYAGATLKVYDEAEVVLGRPPPSNSPFTGPLQTIPSQSTLPVQSLSDRDSLERDSRPKFVVKPTEFSAFAQRLSVLEGSNDLFTAPRSDRKSPIGSDTKSELVDLLREAEHEDALISQCGATGLDAETKESITSTLGMLEGRCGPTNTTVDLDHLSRMFGRLKTGFEKAPKSAAFVEDATVAERFLARHESTASKDSSMSLRVSVDKNIGTPPATRKDDDDAVSQLSRSKTVASKWSTSTVSAKEHAVPSAGSTSRPNTFGLHFEDLPPVLPPKHQANEKPKSIGYPSRTPGKAHRLLGTDEPSIGANRPAARRVSSPTLGVKVPGSVRAAREKACDAVGSRVNNASSTKLDKLPTSNTKVFKVSEDPPRGRLPSAEKPGLRGSTKVTQQVSHSPFAHDANASDQIPRSRSKSRYVLDKINGLFSAKRDKHNSQLPPVPPVKDSLEHERLLPTPKRIDTLGSPLAKGSRASPVTKMPTICPSVDNIHPALRCAPSSASVVHSMMTIGSNADYQDRRSLQALSENLIGRAKEEGDPAKKERLLNFAKVSA